MDSSSAAACAGVAPSLAYVEPTLPVMLTLAAFLLLLNVLHHLLDSFLHVGLLAPLILGALLGSPLANIIPLPVEQAVQSLGYLGLILLVVEGGMATRLDILASPRSFALAFVVGCIGIIMPIALSMVLLPFAFHFSYLESFAVGASLSSTSLGTTFAVISSAGKGRGEGQKGNSKEAPDGKLTTTTLGLVNTRIGSILIGAALLDDIVGLVLSSVIATLGATLGQDSSLSPWSVARPVVTSAALIIVTMAVARLAARPLLTLAGGERIEQWSTTSFMISPHVLPVMLTAWVAFLCAFIAIAYEIGSTVLLGAFCAGAFSTYIYDRVGKTSGRRIAIFDPHQAFNAIRPVQSYILAPFFFASIGAAIPIKDLFQGETVWKGVLFSGLMAAAKVVACLPVLLVSLFKRNKSNTRAPPSLGTTSEALPAGHTVLPRPSRPWPPALLLGFALVARGEIGFLIINIARQVGLLGCDSTSSEGSLAFNVGIWAITLNTLIGPTVVGIFVRSKGLLDEIEGNAYWGLVSR